jgi:hypothetical protein
LEIHPAKEISVTVKEVYEVPLQMLMDTEKSVLVMLLFENRRIFYREKGNSMDKATKIAVLSPGKLNSANSFMMIEYFPFDDKAHKIFSIPGTPQFQKLTKRSSNGYLICELKKLKRTFYVME